VADRQTCFVISPIGPEGSETRKRSDAVFTHVLSPVKSAITRGASIRPWITWLVMMPGVEILSARMAL
jgi:hypothetical protein